MLQRLYDWTLALAGSPDAVWALAAIAFVESSVFPLPPDLLLIPMILAAPDQAWWLATVATLASVAGGFVGYGIGFWGFETLGRRVLAFYGVLDRFRALEALYRRWGAWIIIVKGMTPIPYKLVTIASGAFRFRLATFAVASLICRALRFYLLAALLRAFGPPIRDFIEGRLALATTLFVILLVGGVLALRWLMPRRSGAA